MKELTIEEKQLLLKDLCARLPYGVKVKYAIPTLLVCVRNDRDGIKVITEGTYSEHIYNIEDIKPYLRPMSSMTEEERKEYCQLADSRVFNIFVNPRHELIDWLNKHHFDYRGLIEKGLALEAPEGIYNIK